MKFGIVVFPGSNCDDDAYHAAKDVIRQQAEYIWHKDTDLKGVDVVILPGGFAHATCFTCSPNVRTPLNSPCVGANPYCSAGIASARLTN